MDHARVVPWAQSLGRRTDGAGWTPGGDGDAAPVGGPASHRIRLFAARIVYLCVCIT